MVAQLLLPLLLHKRLLLPVIATTTFLFYNFIPNEGVKCFTAIQQHTTHTYNKLATPICSRLAASACPCRQRSQLAAALATLLVRGRCLFVALSSYLLLAVNGCVCVCMYFCWWQSSDFPSDKYKLFLCSIQYARIVFYCHVFCCYC